MKRLLWTMLVWAFCFLGATYLIRRALLAEGPLLWLLALLPAVACLASILAYGRFLREADELQRLIHSRGLAVGLAATWFALASYPLFERLGAPALDAGDYTLVMAVFYSLGILHGVRQYR